MEENRVNLEIFDKTIEKAEKDPETALKSLKVEGKWRLGQKGPQFESEIKYENGRVIVYSDEPTFLGGGGMAVNPIQYCLYGVASCFAATFAKWAGKEGVELEELTVKIEARLDMSRSFGTSDNPILNDLILDTRLLNTDLNGIHGLYSSKHAGPCIIDFETFLTHAGQFPPSFLQQRLSFSADQDFFSDQLIYQIGESPKTETSKLDKAELWIGGVESELVAFYHNNPEKLHEMPDRLFESLVASICSKPCLLMVAPITSSPTCLSTGRLSPMHFGMTSHVQATTRMFVSFCMWDIK